MKIKRIEFAHKVRDPYIDSIDVFVENEDGYSYTIVEPGTPMIVVKKLIEQIVTEAIKVYAEGEGYWLKLCQFGDELDIVILNKLDAEYREESNEYYNITLENSFNCFTN